MSPLSPKLNINSRKAGTLFYSLLSPQHLE